MIICAAVVAFIGYALLLATGPVSFTVPELIEVLTGGGTRTQITVVWELRLPIAVATVTTGALLGTAGAWTQTAVRNPLASPDVMGISGGAAVAVVAGTIFLPVQNHASMSVFWWRFILAALGALTVIVLLWVLSGSANGTRLVLTGVGISLFSHQAVRFMLSRTDLRETADAQTWLAGSTGLVREPALTPLFLGALPFLLIGMYFSRDLPILIHGDVTATVLGVDAAVVRSMMIIAATGLAAVCVSVTGPIGFVALVAPQLARILAGAPTPPPYASASVGAAMMTLCAVSVNLLPAPVPVGTLTSALGGVALTMLVVRMGRTQSHDPRKN
ncbi:FecCD family ABC transporter permease [Corynebacterium pygosceleis]|uniref:Iron ABC transporter permease n=1 Tax=Corynebacterium pygosceleis TaxID=2800406 RepID=A0A9Q4C9G5_9CORY|nr:iron ABC transporter permease [Corynebacterium pygosceleis]MCK7638369.1 iron ABC transporter permease [Corynebacterium pygosceleis]MCK7675349.1 iron ABC transporter permease [Corynebacterium pygosceleis]MCL0121257.1 iron ABC transporter permease [Corynebacterium pygosceleis]MCX7445472.1 iron ABC transporter permease [Corynebacterium pygosceleis]MCX7469032.1 iron ABC transporter permease [Corynebacterium pygosceleis]